MIARIYSLRRALLFLMPTFLTAMLADAERVPSVAGVALSPEKLMFGMLVLCNVALAYMTPRRGPPLERGLLAITGLCAFSVVVGALWSLQAGPSEFFGSDFSKYILKLCIPLVVCWSMGDGRDLRAFCMGFIALAVYTIAGMARIVAGGVALTELQFQDAIGGTMWGNRNNTAMFLMLGAIASIFFRRFSARSKPAQTALLLFGAFALALVPFTLSRTGIIGLALLAGLWAIAPSQVRWRWIGAVVLVSVLVYSLRGLAGPLDLLVERVSLLRPSQIGESDYAREAIWTAAFAALKESPILGLGLGQYRYFVSAQFSISTLSIHNAYLLLYCDLGLLGLVSFGLLLSTYFVRVWRLKRTGDPFLDDLAMGTASMFVVVLLFGLTSDVYHHNLPWLAVALGPAGWQVWRIEQHRRAIVSIPRVVPSVLPPATEVSVVPQ